MTDSPRAGERRLRSIPLYVILSIVLVPMLLPYYWMLASSLKTPLQNLQFPPALVFAPTLDNYANILQHEGIPAAVWESFVVGTLATSIGLVLGLPCAFAIARFQLRPAGLVVLVARMLPGIALLIPWYLMFLSLHLLDSYAALVLSHLSITLPLVIWLSIGFFEDLPNELMDAAAIDGCSLFQAFSQIALPLVRAGIIAAAVLGFVASWNNFLYSVVLGGTLRLAPVATYNLIKEVGTDWGALNAAAVVTTWPVIVLALPFAKHMVRGLTAGAIKG